MRKNLTIAFIVFAIADVLLAQVARFLRERGDVKTIERTYRVPSPIYHHDLLPMVDAVGAWGSLRYDIHTDSLGFKDAACRVVPLRTDRYRILFIGDSFTEGLGYPYEQTFVGLIAQALAGREIEVLNAAVASYSPTIYYRKIKYLIEVVGLQLDEVVVFLDLSDIHDEAVLYRTDDRERVTLNFEQAPSWAYVWVGTPEPDADDLRARISRFAREHSVTLGLLGMLHDSRRAEAMPRVPRDSERVVWTFDKAAFEAYGRRGLAQARREMDHLLRLLQRRGITLRVAVYPWPEQVRHHDLDSIQVRFWRRWAERRGIELIDLFPPFFGQPPVETIAKYFIPGDAHFNETGHRLIANRFLAQYVLGPDTAPSTHIAERASRGPVRSAFSTGR